MSPDSRTLRAAAEAPANIALVKYWGKRDPALNLPAAGSLSLTLAALRTRTSVSFEPGLEADHFTLDGRLDAAAAARVSACLDLLRGAAGCRLRARVSSRNNFPTAAGLASSASGFAALVVAAAAALGLPDDPRQLSRWARRGSGSAARSLHGGFVLMHAGSRADGRDAFAEQLAPAAHWPLELVIAVVEPGPKAIGSRAGMAHGAATSPFHAAWVDSVAADLAAARAAIAARDFAALAAVSEHSCLKMHASMMASRPPLLYWTPATLACTERVRALREDDGREVFFTIDAGPQVKAVCRPADAAAVRAALAAVPGVHAVLHSPLGAGARRVEPAQAA